MEGKSGLELMPDARDMHTPSFNSPILKDMMHHHLQRETKIEQTAIFEGTCAKLVI